MSMRIGSFIAVVKTKVLVSDSCPHCTTLKRRLTERGKLDSVDLVDVYTQEGMALAKEHGIKAIPECVVIGADGKPRKCTESEFMDLVK
jgi:predicted DCC family thiol-disulfide oxidoreductase YuxK